MKYQNNPKKLLEDLAKKAGSPELEAALKHLYKNVFNQLYSHVLKNNGDLADAKAMMSVGLQELYEKIQLGKLKNRKNLYGLLLKICKNRWYDELRRAKPVDYVIDEPQSAVMRKLVATSPEKSEAIEEEKRNAIVREELEKIKPPPKDILMDKYFGGLSIKELAERYKYSIAYIRIILYRTRKELRNRLLQRPDFII